MSSTVVDPAVKDGSESVADPELRAYNQWVAFEIAYLTSSSESLEIRDARLAWGKWYQYPDKNKEISAPNGTIINPGSPVTIASCGRQNASSGTEGSFNLYAKPSDRKIASVSWDCPWSGSNVLNVTSLTNDYIVQNSSYTPSGEIGHIHIKVAKIG